MKTTIDLQHDVSEELAWEPSVDAAGIGVTVADGIVTLTGRVASYAQKIAAEAAALRTTGVRGVVDELAIDLPGPHVREDQDIAEAVLHSLAWDVRVPPDKIKIVVKNGWVTLEGEVDWAYQRDAALEDVRRLYGVRGVVSEIGVTPHYASAAEIAARIERAFERNAQLDASRIRVESRGATVVLHGEVRTMAERVEAARAAWAAPGVASVENDLKVSPP